VNDGNHGDSGFVRHANECGTRYLGRIIAANGVQARFHSSDYFRRRQRSRRPFGRRLPQAVT